jgi:hypothetical protein
VRLGKAVEAKITTYIAAGAIEHGMPCYLASTGKVAPARANAVGTINKLVGVSVSEATAAGDPIDVLENGLIAAGFDLSGEAYGATLYVSTAVAGKLTTTIPATTGQVVAPVGCVGAATDPALTKYLHIDVDLTAVRAALP